MSVDIKKAINMPFKDPDWLQKLLIGGLFYFASQVINTVISISDYFIAKNYSYTNTSLIALFSTMTFKLLIVVLLLLLSAVPVGYVLQSVHKQLTSKNYLLPEWSGKFYYYFINGLKFIFINLIYCSASIFLFCLIPVLSGIEPFKSNAMAYHSVTILFALLIFTFIACYIMLAPIIFIFFAKNFSISDAFDIKKMFKNLSNNLNDYFLCILLTTAAAIAQGLLSLLLVCTCIGILFIPFLQLPISLIVINLFTQVYLSSKTSV